MRLLRSYLFLALALLLFLALLGAFVLVGTSGIGVLIFIEAMRYVSPVGKIALAFLGAGTFFFLIQFVFSKEAK